MFDVGLIGVLLAATRSNHLNGLLVLPAVIPLAGNEPTVHLS
ncbi:hypothetical protein [Rubrivivax sp. A210]|nr:hypothetical protein [Rubrivivax sp. A210]